MRALLGLACLLLPLESPADIIQQEAARIDKFRVIQQSAKQYAKALGLDGRSAKDAWSELTGRGFECAMKDVYLTAKESEPMILCDKAPTEIQDCLSLLVSVSVRWQEPRRPINELLGQEPDSQIKYVAATCKVR